MKSMEHAFRVFCMFRTAIKAGKKPLLIGSDYVAMSREFYDKLMEKMPGAADARNDNTEIWYDEMAEISPKTFELLIERSTNGTVKA